MIHNVILKNIGLLHVSDLTFRSSVRTLIVVYISYVSRIGRIVGLIVRGLNMFREQNCCRGRWDSVSMYRWCCRYTVFIYM